MNIIHTNLIDDLSDQLITLNSLLKIVAQNLSSIEYCNDIFYLHDCFVSPHNVFAKWSRINETVNDLWTTIEKVGFETLPISVQFEIVHSLLSYVSMIYQVLNNEQIQKQVETLKSINNGEINHFIVEKIQKEYAYVSGSWTKIPQYYIELSTRYENSMKQLLKYWMIIREGFNQFLSVYDEIPEILDIGTVFVSKVMQDVRVPGLASLRMDQDDTYDLFPLVEGTEKKSFKELNELFSLMQKYMKPLRHYYEFVVNCGIYKDPVAKFGKLQEFGIDVFYDYKKIDEVIGNCKDYYKNEINEIEQLRLDNKNYQDKNLKIIKSLLCDFLCISVDEFDDFYTTYQDVLQEIKKIDPSIERVLEWSKSKFSGKYLLGIIKMLSTYIYINNSDIMVFNGIKNISNFELFNSIKLEKADCESKISQHERKEKFLSEKEIESCQKIIAQCEKILTKNADQEKYSNGSKYGVGNILMLEFLDYYKNDFGGNDGTFMHQPIVLHCFEQIIIYTNKSKDQNLEENQDLLKYENLLNALIENMSHRLQISKDIDIIKTKLPISFNDLENFSQPKNFALATKQYVFIASMFPEHSQEYLDYITQQSNPPMKNQEISLVNLEKPVQEFYQKFIKFSKALEREIPPLKEDVSLHLQIQYLAEKCFDLLNGDSYVYIEYIPLVKFNNSHPEYLSECFEKNSTYKDWYHNHNWDHQRISLSRVPMLKFDDLSLAEDPDFIELITSYKKITLTNQMYVQLNLPIVPEKTSYRNENQIIIVREKVFQSLGNPENMLLFKLFEQAFLGKSHNPKLLIKDALILIEQEKWRNNTTLITLVTFVMSQISFADKEMLFPKKSNVDEIEIKNIVAKYTQDDEENAEFHHYIKLLFPNSWQSILWEIPLDITENTKEFLLFMLEESLSWLIYNAYFKKNPTDNKKFEKFLDRKIFKDSLNTFLHDFSFNDKNIDWNIKINESDPYLMMILIHAISSVDIENFYTLYDIASDLCDLYNVPLNSHSNNLTGEQWEQNQAILKAHDTGCVIHDYPMIIYNDLQLIIDLEVRLFPSSIYAIKIGRDGKSWSQNWEKYRLNELQNKILTSDRNKKRHLTNDVHTINNLCDSKYKNQLINVLKRITEDIDSITDQDKSKEFLKEMISTILEKVEKHPVLKTESGNEKFLPYAFDRELRILLNVIFASNKSYGWGLYTYGFEFPERYKTQCAILLLQFFLKFGNQAFTMNTSHIKNIIY